MHRSQIFLYLLLAFIIGILAGSFFSIPQPAVIIAIIVCATAVAVFFRRGSKLLNPKITLGAFLVLLFLFGILRFNLSHNRSHVLEKFAEAAGQLQNVNAENRFKITLVGYIDDEPETRGDKQQIIFKSKQALSAGRVIDTDERVLITAPLYPRYQYGQKLRISGELRLPENFSPDFDYRAYLSKNDILTLTAYPEITETKFRLGFGEGLKLLLYRNIFKLKGAFIESVNRSLAEPQAAYINGILLGARSQIPADLKTAFARTSTSHILAISGYNITIIAWVVSWFFLLFFKRPTAFWFSLAGIALFTILTGAQASVIRAAVMGAVLLLAQRQGRLYSSQNGIILAGAVMILINPEVLRYDLGFQLSFAATLGLIFLGPLLEARFAKLPQWFGFRETMLMTVAAQIFVLPLLLLYFNNLSLVSLPANLLILPLIPYLMALGFVMAVAGMIVPLAGQIVGYFVWLLNTAVLGIVKIFAAPDWAVVSVQFPWYLAVASYLALAFVINVARRKPAKT